MALASPFATPEMVTFQAIFFKLDHKGCIVSVNNHYYLGIYAVWVEKRTSRFPPLSGLFLCFLTHFPNDHHAMIFIYIAEKVFRTKGILKRKPYPIQMAYVASLGLKLT